MTDEHGTEMLDPKPINAGKGIDRELEYWHSQVLEKERIVSALSFEAQNLKVSLNVFLGEYNSRVGSKFLDLDKLKLKIKEHEYRIYLLQHKHNGLDTVEQVEHQVAEFFMAERQKIEELENEVVESARQYENFLADRDAVNSLSDEEQEEVKKLYRQLALKFHPDRAENDVQRIEYNRLMAEINGAYEKNNLEELRTFMRRVDRDASIAREAGIQRLARLKQEYKILTGISYRLKNEIDAIKASETHMMRDKVQLARDSGIDMMERISANVEREMAKAEARFDELEKIFSETLQNIEYCYGHLADSSRLASFDPRRRKELVIRGIGAAEGMKDADYYFLKGEEHKVKGEMLKAIANYEKTLELNPEHEDALFWLAYCYAPDVNDLPGMDDTACWEKACALFERLAVIKERNGGKGGGVYAVYYNLAQAQYNLARYEDAVSSYKRGLELNPAHADSLYNLGITQSVLGYYEEAVLSFQKAIEANPDDPSYYYNIGLVLDKMNMRDKALENMKRYLELMQAKVQEDNEYMAYARRRIQEWQARPDASRAQRAATGVSRRIENALRQTGGTEGK